jgi:aryl-alcohol dehydrogenase-like predicted oxidoreductase
MRRGGPAELILGSVQLGLPYGVTNRTGKPPRAAALRLVQRAAEGGIAAFDTARAYGDAEARLGEASVARTFRAYTKLLPLDDLAPDAPRPKVRAAVDESIAVSLSMLKRGRLDCLLLHRASHLTAFDGAIWERLLEHRQAGVVGVLGVSVQSPAEAHRALATSEGGHLQLPFNLLDWRWGEAGVIAAIRERPELSVHARSVFLQGLLAANEPKFWPSINNVDASLLVAWLCKTAARFGRESAADLALSYVRGQDWIDGVVIGMETEDQLDANLRLATRPPLDPSVCAAIEAERPTVPETLLNPALWRRP